MIISVEGNIGSGKSTLVHWLKNEFKDDCRFIFLQEPVDMWLNNVDKKGENILNKFYNNQEKYAFSFQVMSYTSKLHLIKEAMKNNPGKIIITERCVHTDREVFAKMLYNDGKIEDVYYNIYQAMFDEFLNDMGVSKFIYVKTDPKICQDRIKKRKRNEETGIELEYLKKCDHYHEEWMKNIGNILCLDGNNEFKNDVNLLKKWKSDILEFIMSGSVSSFELADMYTS
jgi:deoxyadenosine/deoxycytidine kinase